MSQPLHHQSATALLAGLRRKDFGARELLEHFLARVDRINPGLNAIVVQDRERARARADAADAAQGRGESLGPLHGLPMTIKESFDWAGTPATWGVPQWKDRIASTDALAIERLSAAGVNVFGKTNVPIRLADFQSYNEIYGTTENPWKSGVTPGGSSGGSAAALAAGLCALEIGSDIGGSIRNPSHFCGVFGHKPTWNLLPMRGHGAALTPTDISVIGPLARSAFDLELMMRLLALPDEIEAPALRWSLPVLDRPLSGLRVALWESESICPASADVRARVRAVAQALAAQGAQIDDQARPQFSVEDSHETFEALLASAMAARIPQADFDRMSAIAQAAAPDDQTPLVRQARWQTMRAREWGQRNETRTQMRWAWHRFFERFDLLITPIMPTTAFAHDHRSHGKRQIRIDGHDHPYFCQTFWAGLAGVSLLPATVIPGGLGSDGLPIGVQLIGPAYSDLKLIQVAQRLEQLGFTFQPPPESHSGAHHAD
jgi:amidase